MITNKLVEQEYFEKAANYDLYGHLHWTWLRNDINCYNDFMRFELMPMFPGFKWSNRADYALVFETVYFALFCLECLNPHDLGKYVEIRLIDKVMRYGAFDSGGFQGQNIRAYYRLHRAIDSGIALGLLESTYKFRRSKTPRYGHDVADKVVLVTDKGRLLVQMMQRKLKSLSNDDLLNGSISKKLSKYFLHYKRINKQREENKLKIMSKSHLKRNSIRKQKTS